MRDFYERLLYVILGVFLSISFLFFHRYHEEKQDRKDREILINNFHNKVLQENESTTTAR